MPRGKGWGSIQRRGKKYLARYSAPDGKKYSRTFTTRQTADRWLAHERVLIDSDEWNPPSVRKAQVGGFTFAQWAKEWVSECRARGLRDNTVRWYTRVMDHWVTPVIGDVQVSKIGSVEVERVLRNVDAVRSKTNPEAPFSANSVSVRRALKVCLRDAQRKGLIRHVPNIRLVSTRDNLRGAADAIADVGQVFALARLFPPQYAISVHLATWCQLRVSEVCGLQRRDIDLGAGVIHVRRQYLRESGGARYGPLKSRAGYRSVGFPAFMADMLKAHLEQFTGDGDEAPLMLTQRRNPVNAFSLGQSLRRAREQVPGCEKITFHRLRHTGLTLYAREGATVQELMHRGGHSSVQIALRYQHATRERDDFLTRKLSETVAKQFPQPVDNSLWINEKGD